MAPSARVPLAVTSTPLGSKWIGGRAGDPPATGHWQPLPARDRCDARASASSGTFAWSKLPVRVATTMMLLEAPSRFCPGARWWCTLNAGVRAGWPNSNLWVRLLGSPLRWAASTGTGTLPSNSGSPEAPACSQKTSQETMKLGPGQPLCVVGLGLSAALGEQRKTNG